MDKKLSDTYTEIAQAIAALEGATDEMAVLRRAQLNDSACDFWLGMENVLKQAGRNTEAAKARSLADKHWSAVVIDLDQSTD